MQGSSVAEFTGQCVSTITHRGTRPRSRPASALAVILLGLATGLGSSVQAQTFTVLYSFAGYPTDGAGPEAGLLMDASGNLYGTTKFGGSVNLSYCGNSGYSGCGTVFELSSSGAETVLQNFDGTVGANPTSNLIMDASGGLYGTTEFGGEGDCYIDGTLVGCGVVFKIVDGEEDVLYQFAGGADGANPLGGLVMDSNGNLYGTAQFGGYVGGCDCGVVFEVAGQSETVLHNFSGNRDGAFPYAGLIMDAEGAFYGTTNAGGSSDPNCAPDGCGVVFKLVGRKETLLHRFKGSPDGAYPYAALSMDANGNLYGTTADGGNGENSGTVFEVNRYGSERVLYTFQLPLGHPGFRPQSSVILDNQGNLYGTALEGGLFNAGILFEISRNGGVHVLHNFCSLQNCADGSYPNDLVMDAKGYIYGTTFGGGANSAGTVFMIIP